MSPKEGPIWYLPLRQILQDEMWNPFTYRPHIFQPSVVLLFVLSESAQEPFIKQIFCSL